MFAFRGFRNLLGNCIRNERAMFREFASPVSTSEDAKEGVKKKQYVKIFELQKQKNWDDYFKGVALPYNSSTFKLLK